MLIFTVLGFAAQVCVISAIVAVIIDCVSLPQPNITTDSTAPDATLSDTVSTHCALAMVSPVYVTTIHEPSTPADDYSAMTIRELKTLCKDRGIKRYSSLRKHELIALLSEF